MAGLYVAAGALGIIGVSQQVAQSAFKIKAFCKEVKEAPAELRELTQSLESLSRILIRLGDVVAAAPDADTTYSNADLLRESLRTCQHAAERIAVFVQEAQQQLAKRRYRGSCTFVLKKREIQSMLQKLDRSKSDLSIALAIFACPVSQKYTKRSSLPEDEASDVTTLVPAPGTASNLRAGGTPSPHSGQVQSTSYRLGLPKWLCEHVWMLAWTHAAGQWTFTLRTFRVVDPTGPAMIACFFGDVKDIQTMLESRTLSVNDECPDGWSLYTHAATRGHYELTRFLLEHGATPTELPRRFKFGPYSDLMYHDRCLSHSRSREPLQDLRRHVQLLLDHWIGDPDICVWTMARPHTSWTKDERLAALGSMSFADRPQTFMGLLGNDVIDAAQFPTPVAGRTGLLHVIARNAAYFMTPGCNIPKSHVDLTWFKQVRAYADTGGPLHHLDEDGYTALMLLVLGGIGTAAAKMPRVRLWAKALHLAGVDLVAYGETEQAILAANSQVKESFDDQGIFGVSYDARPEEWCLRLRHIGDLHAGLFWHALDSPELSVPGGWPCYDDAETAAAMESTWNSWFRRPFQLKRSRIRRLQGFYKRASDKGGEDRMSMLASIQQLRESLTQYGQLRRARDVVPATLTTFIMRQLEILNIPNEWGIFPSGPSAAEMLATAVEQWV